jgi:hypothetical protein
MKDQGFLSTNSLLNGDYDAFDGFTQPWDVVKIYGDDGELGHFKNYY